MNRPMHTFLQRKGDNLFLPKGQQSAILRRIKKIAGSSPNVKCTDVYNPDGDFRKARSVLAPEIKRKKDGITMTFGISIGHEFDFGVSMHLREAYVGEATRRPQLFGNEKEKRSRLVFNFLNFPKAAKEFERVLKIFVETEDLKIIPVDFSSSTYDHCDNLFKAWQAEQGGL